MSQYADQTDLSRYGLPTAATSGLASADLDAQLQAASSVADSYLASRGYTTPIGAWGEDLRAAVCRIAAWSILVNLRGVNPEDPAHDAVRLSQQDAIGWLRDVARGTANLSAQATLSARTAPGVAQVFVTSQDDGGDTRGW